MRIDAILVAALLPLAGQAVAQSHLDIIRDTPCAYEYRLWFFTFRRSEHFEVPKEFTKEQCDRAAEVSRRINEEQARGITGSPETSRNPERDAELELQRAADERARLERERADKVARDVETREKARQAKWRAEQDVLRRKPGVSVGMTKDDVLTKSSWGAPFSKNRMTTAAGVEEQWVYGGRNYLYFKNGVLVAIQN